MASVGMGQKSQTPGNGWAGRAGLTWIAAPATIPENAAPERSGPTNKRHTGMEHGMKSASLILGIAIALAVALPAHARKGGDGDLRGQGIEERGGDMRSGLRRDGGGFEQDRRDRGRLTPEERRDLRRDIRDAGRDIYPDQRRRRRD
jgi:hypothetical protein